MKKQFYILGIALLSFAICTSLISCVKDVYVGDDSDKEEKPEPSVPNEEEQLPDLSVPKTFDWNEVYIKIPLLQDIDVNDIQIYFPSLKYNKSFAYSYTFDDCTAMAYGKAYCTINKKWVDNCRYFHVNQKKTAGFTPSKTLGYTDGCGNEHRFAFGISIWPDMHTAYIDDFMNPSNKIVDGNYPHLVWNDIIAPIDFGCDIYFHDVNTNGDNSVDGILKGLKSSQKITEEKLGRKMKVLSRPNGNNDYITACRQYDDIVFMATEGVTDIGIPPLINIAFDNDIDLNKAIQYRRNAERTPSVGELMSLIDEKALSKTYTWIHDFSHGPENFQFILDLFTTINDKYGKDGKDCIWFASLDEIYEYNYIRNNYIIEKSVSNNVLTLKFSCPSSNFPNELQFHRDFSVIIKGVTSLSTTDISFGKNVYGLSMAKQNNDSWMINIDCNKSLLDKAERYTSVFEKEQSTSTKEDALYFVNRLNDNLRKSYNKRIK